MEQGEKKNDRKCKGQMGHDKIYNIDLIGVIEGRKKRVRQKLYLNNLIFFSELMKESCYRSKTYQKPWSKYKENLRY